MWEIEYEYRDKEYYVKSKIRAVQSRNEFQNLSVMDEILLRFYGKFGLTLNKIMRFTNNKLTLWISNIAKKDFQNYTKKLSLMAAKSWVLRNEIYAAIHDPYISALVEVENTKIRARLQFFGQLQQLQIKLHGIV